MAETAYARVMRRERKKQRDKDKKPGTRKAAQERGFCGAKKRNGEICQMRAGMGTDHPGIGYCHHHGGLVASHRLNAIQKEAVFMGAPKEINPLDALLWCIKITAGEVEWLSDQLKELKESDWTKDTIVGEQLHIWAKERQIAVARLARYSTDAVKLGLDERRVRLAEQYGNSIGRLLKGVLDDLMPHIDPAGIKKIPEIISKHMAIMETGSAREEPKELVA